MEISVAEIWPMPRSELLELVKFAKTRPSLADVQAIIDFLNMRFRGVTNPEAFEMIDSIASHFTEEVRQQMEEQMRQYAARDIRSRLNLPELGLADDEQITSAILRTAPIMSGGLFGIISEAVTLSSGMAKSFSSFSLSSVATPVQARVPHLRL